ncbi:MAG: PHP domain-containing protein [Bdellovibrionota bacterium]
MAKEKFVELLEELAQAMEIVGENDFKIRAYRKGAQAIGDSDESLSDIASGKVKIAGVGEGLRKTIQEFLDTGEVAQKKELTEKIPEGVFDLMQVSGLGPKKAMIVHKELGVSTLGELEYACRENRLTTLKGFGPAIQKKVLNSLEDLKARKGKLRLDEALEFSDALATKILKKLPKSKKPPSEVLKLGALARHLEIVDLFEIGIVTEPAHFEKLVENLEWSSAPQIQTHLVLGTDFVSCSGTLAEGYAVVLWGLAEKPEGALLKWLCAEQSVRPLFEKDPKRVEGWQISWLEPVWIESKRKPHSDAYRLEKHGRVKGFFHCHTNYSDGNATLEEMVHAAEKGGYEYIGISDHSKSAFYARGLQTERILEQRKRIKELQKKVSIKIFHGIESDILADGALDYDEEVLNGFDFIVGSIHSRFQMDQTAMTERLVRALENPHITIWGHPTGRLLLGRKPYLLDWDRCLTAAAINGVAVEINCNPHRLDIDWRMGAELEKFKSKVCINPDAHAVEGVEDTIYGEYMAEKAMVPCGSILNLMGADEMEKYLWQRKKRASR